MKGIELYFHEVGTYDKEWVYWNFVTEHDMTSNHMHHQLVLRSLTRKQTRPHNSSKEPCGSEAGQGGHNEQGWGGLQIGQNIWLDYLQTTASVEVDDVITGCQPETHLYSHNQVNKVSDRNLCI